MRELVDRNCRDGGEVKESSDDTFHDPARSSSQAGHRRRRPAAGLEPAEPLPGRPAAARPQAAVGGDVQPQRRRASDLLAGRGGRIENVQTEPPAAGAVSPADADAARHLRQDPRRRRQPHARHRLPVDRRRASARQHPGRFGHSGRLGQRSVDRPGDQESLAEGPGHADAVRLAGVRRAGAQSGRHLDADGLCRAEQAAGADQQSLSDVQPPLRPRQGPREPAERDGRSPGRASRGQPAAQFRRPPVAPGACHVRPRDGAGVARFGRRPKSMPRRRSSRA